MPDDTITALPLLKTLRETCSTAVERNLSSFLERSSRQGLPFTTEMARYQFSTGGKRLRALIPCWVYSAYGHDPLQAIGLGSAIEIVHNATLVHDDLQDGDTVRRGQPTLWRKYSSVQAINCGDALFQFAIQMILELPLAPHLRSPLALRLLRAVNQVIEGQAQEFLLKEKEVPTLSDYLRVADGKTAALFAASLVLPLVALERSASFCDEVENASRSLGILFQIQDDILDIYGEKAREKRATDVAEGKISFLVAKLLDDARPEDRDRALRILRKPREETTDGDVSEILALYEHYGTLSAALRRIEIIYQQILDLPWRKEEPAMHGLLIQIGRIFLDPIHHLWPDAHFQPSGQPSIRQSGQAAG